MRALVHVSVLALALSSPLFLFACTSSNLSVTSPTSNKCSVTLSSTPSSFGASGGSGQLTVDTSRDCTWSIGTDSGWVAISGNRSGQGQASVAYSVAPNSLPAARTATITASGASLQLSQAGSLCHYSLSQTGDSIGPNGGSLSVAISTVSGCAWSAASTAGWIAIVSGQQGNASGTVQLKVDANDGPRRVGTVTVASRNFTVTQDAAPPSGPAPDPNPPPPSGGQTESFLGIVANASGQCPDLTFSVSGLTVITDRSTRFKHISCDEVASGGRLVSGDGTIVNQAIHADVVNGLNND